MKIYVLSTGEYSDCRVMGVFSTREKAEVYGRQFNSEDIGEFELDVLTPHPEGYQSWELWINVETGEILKPHVNDDQPNERYAFMLTYNNIEAIIHCWARDEAHAIKIAGERRAEYLARKAGA